MSASHPMHKPAYLKDLEKIDGWDELVRPTDTANTLNLKHPQFFQALNAGIFPSYTVAGQRFVCTSEI